MTPDSSQLFDKVPILDKTSSTETGAEQNLDWPRGEHNSTAKHVNTDEIVKTWEIEQTLSGLSGIAELLVAGKAAFSVEARCLATAWCELFVAEKGAQNVHLGVPVDDTRGAVSLHPGVLTLEDCELATDDLHPIHQSIDQTTIPIAAGHWLILGQAITIQATDKEAMVSFEGDENLHKGQMEIEQRRTDDMRFVVKVPQATFETRIQHDPVLRWGCWLAVLAMLPYVKDYEIVDDVGVNTNVPGSRIGQDLANKLQYHDIPLWNDEEHWDPSKVITIALMRFPDMPQPQE